LSLQIIEELRKENSEYRKEMFILASKLTHNNNIGNTKTTTKTQFNNI